MRGESRVLSINFPCAMIAVCGLLLNGIVEQHTAVSLVAVVIIDC